MALVAKALGGPTEGREPVQGEVSALIQFLLNQGVAVAVLVWFLVRLEHWLQRIDRLMTLWADSQGLLDHNGDPKQSLR